MNKINGLKYFCRRYVRPVKASPRLYRKLFPARSLGALPQAKPGLSEVVVLRRRAAMRTDRAVRPSNPLQAFQCGNFTLEVRTAEIRLGLQLRHPGGTHRAAWCEKSSKSDHPLISILTLRDARSRAVRGECGKWEPRENR